MIEVDQLNEGILQGQGRAWETASMAANPQASHATMRRAIVKSRVGTGGHAATMGMEVGSGANMARDSGEGTGSTAALSCARGLRGASNNQLRHKCVRPSRFARKTGVALVQTATAVRAHRLR
eukprot:6213990-Pleurochrysis_carterae.AAC.5